MGETDRTVLLDRSPLRRSIPLLLEGKELTPSQVKGCFEEMMLGEGDPVAIAGFLMALRMKGETVQEIASAARVLRKWVRPVKTPPKIILDTCGTGGDRSGTFNISTLSAFVAAGAGALVAKHGNRSVSSRCGSADLLEKLGVDVEQVSLQAEETLRSCGIAFLFAPSLHPAMRHVAPIRRVLGVRTIFNLLGPLANPASARHQLLGVFSNALTRPMTEVLKALGSRHVLVVHGLDGLDEVTTTTATAVTELKGGRLKSFRIHPRQFGIKTATPGQLKGGDIETNARIAEGILSGEKGPRREVVLLNAACALYAADRVRTIAEGLEQARHSLDSGKALEKLKLLREFGRREVA